MGRRGAVAGARSRRSSAGQPVQAQLALDRGDGRPHDREGPGGRDVVAAGQVERTQDGAGVRVVDGGRRAAPRGDRPGQVLGREDLHGLVQRQGGAGSVGAGAVLGPPAPSTKWMRSARRRSCLGPSTQSRRPAASLTATSRPVSAASSTSSRRITGITWASGWLLRQHSSSASAISIGATARSGSRPPSRLRRQDCVTRGRSRRSASPVLKNRSCASLISRDSAEGSAPVRHARPFPLMLRSPRRQSSRGDRDPACALGPGQRQLSHPTSHVVTL